MIKTIAIKNFQSHEATKLDLHPGVNVIGGQSDCGKTAVIRGLKWLATNRPSGDAYRSRWGGDTEVGVALEGGAEITRYKTKTVNAYNLVPGDDSDAVMFKALGTDVPEAVREALNISPLSWQSQMDAPFLLSESPGEVARILNEVADLEKIDVATANINRMARDNSAAVANNKALIDSLRADVETFADVDDQLARVARMRESDRKATLLEGMVRRAEELVRNAGAQEIKLRRIPDTFFADDLVASITKKIEMGKSLEAQIEAALSLENESDRLHKGLRRFKAAMPDPAAIDKLLKMVQEADALGAKAIRMNMVVGRMNELEEFADYGLESVAELEAEWKRTFPEQCPLCGQEVVRK